MPIAPLDYLQAIDLTDADRSTVEAHLSAVRLNNAHSIRLRVDNGHHLIAIKRLIGHGGWMAWLLSDAASGYHSARTVERDMALADALGHSLDGFSDDQLAQSTNLTALRELAADPNADALAAALALFKRGVAVMPAQAAALADVGTTDKRLLDSVVAGRMTLADAQAVAGALAQPMAAEVEELVLAAGVRSPEVVDALVVMQQEAPQMFTEVEAARALYNPVTETQVPLNAASSGDAGAALAVDDAEREARRIQTLRGWRTGRPLRLADLVGGRGDVLSRLAALLPDDGTQFHVYAYPEPVAEPEGAVD